MYLIILIVPKSRSRHFDILLRSYLSLKIREVNLETRAMKQGLQHPQVCWKTQWIHPSRYQSSMKTNMCAETEKRFPGKQIWETTTDLSLGSRYIFPVPLHTSLDMISCSQRRCMNSCTLIEKETCPMDLGVITTWMATEKFGRS